jgi:hypothetical protein
MTAVKVFLKGWRDSRLYTDAVNRDSHPLHEAALADHYRSYVKWAPGDHVFFGISYPSELTDDLAICEQAFEWFNIGPDHLPVVQIYRQSGLRSLSVGDVIVLDDERAYTCASFGWDLLDTFEPVEVSTCLTD